MQELRIGALSFNAIDFGERIAMSMLVRKELARGDEQKINQYTLLHMSVALEWVDQKRPKRIPSCSRVAEAARRMRDRNPRIQEYDRGEQECNSAS